MQEAKALLTQPMFWVIIFFIAILFALIIQLPKLSRYRRCGMCLKNLTRIRTEENTPICYACVVVFSNKQKDEMCCEDH